MSDITIRPYEVADRERVREICYATGYLGDPVDWLWRDKESFCDLFTLYYTDGEPESALVAELDGVVEGYLLGCRDSTKAWRYEKIFLRHLLRRGIAFRAGTAGVIWRTFLDAPGDAMRHRLPPASVTDDRWPAHLHIDFMPAIRGHGVGRQLVGRWIETLREQNVAGCHLETFGENRSAIAFFESMGFRSRGGPWLVPGWRTPTGKRHTVRLFAQAFRDGN